MGNLKIKKSKVAKLIPSVNHFPDTDTVIWNEADGKLWGLRIVDKVKMVTLIGGGFNALEIVNDKYVRYNVNHKEGETILHNMNKKPSVSIINADGDSCIADVKYINDNSITVFFTDYFTGQVLLN